MHHVALLILLQAILLPLSHAANATATPLPRFAGINLNQFQYSTSLDSADSNIGTGTYRLFWSLDSPSLRASFLPTTFKISPSTKLTRPNGGIFDLTIPNTTDTASILHVCLVLDITKARLLSGKGITNATQSSNVWAGIAFGDTMLDAQFVVANAFDTANITVKQFFINERTPIVAYGPPAIINFPGALGMVPGIGIIEQGYFIAEFRLLLTEVPDTASILWAFYAGSASSDGRVFGMFHNLNKGVEIIQFAKGAVLQSFTVSLFFNRLHACGMAASVFMFFVGIVYARFLRHRSEWLIVHIICQVLGIILQISFVLLMAVTLPKETQNGLGLDVNVHSVIGIVILTVLGVQTILGALACFSMRIEMMQKIRPVLRVLHRYTGHLFLTACLVQTFIGMNILFPFLATPPRGREVWGVFVTLWVLVMVGMIIWEVFYRLRYSNKSAMTRTKSTSWRNFLNFSWPFKKHTKIIDDMGTESKNGTFKVIGVDEYRREISPFDEKAMNKEQQQMEKAKSLLLSKTLEKQDNTENGLKKMTWEDIDESTRTGNLL
ncbi:hypothetical protein HK096_011409 [Nowakowskiella sp. JEL0078]|nr:hypothetical protein HK096_011409 [Nowakowskiella sp. JEL0078]